MKIKYEIVLRILYEETVRLGQTKVGDVDIKCHGDERKEICEWLEENEYIDNVVILGQSKISCTVTFNAIDYFLKKDKENK